MMRRELLIGAGALGALTSVGACVGERRAVAATSGGEQRMTRSYGAGMIATTFSGGASGAWSIERITAICGETLPAAPRLTLAEGIADAPGSMFVLQRVTSHARYVERVEKTALDAASPPIGRPEARRGALIPIRKSAAWWAMPQDERRAIFEARSRHIADSMQYLPRIARRLYHARELGSPFDFLTYFEFAPEHSQAFDDLLGMLRGREEWTFVEREVEVRIAR